MALGDICSDCAVRDRALCATLDDRELQTLNTLGQRRRIKRGETVIWAGDENVICANLLSGVLKMSASTPNGREQIVGVLYPADFIGRPYAEDAEFTVTALSDAELCVFPRRPFEGVLKNHQRMERLLLQRTFSALNEARARMLMLARQSAGERVAAFLLEMARRADPGCGATTARFELPLTRGQMGEVLGLTIETVSRQLTELKAAEVIALNGRTGVTILDASALQARAEPT